MTKLSSNYKAIYKLCVCRFLSEVESSRTSLASRTQLEVLGLELCKSSKMPCLRLEDSTIFWLVERRSRAMLFRLGTRQRICEKKFLTLEVCRKIANFWAKTFLFFEIACFLRKLCKNIERAPLFYFFWEHFRVVSLVLGLKRVCPRKVCP